MFLSDISANLRALLASKGVLALLVLLATVGMMNWKLPTWVEIEVSTDRFSMIVGGEKEKSSRILNSLQFESLTIQHYREIRLRVGSGQMADPSRYDLKNDRFPEDAWSDLDLQTSSISFIPAGNVPSMVFEPGDAELLGSIQPIWAAGGTAIQWVFQSGETASLSLSLQGTGVSLFFRVSGPLHMISEQGTIKELVEGLADNRGSNSFRFFLAEQIIEVVGGPELIVLNFKLKKDSQGTLFSDGTLPAASLDFTRQGPMGLRESSLRGTGIIRYTHYPGVSPVQMSAPDFVELGELERFLITSLDIASDNSELQLVAEGVAGRIRTGLPQLSRDHRLSLFEHLWHSEKMRQLFGVWKSVK